ncbi:RidA family protein [Spiroplasma sp. DGKH1]|uniref:RidA family protein n=1 Tax=Spiroplasma sp. DGKH1 TaxID=3050074 RepID=UPI0034C632E4
MAHQVINTDQAPSAIGPYSQAIKAGDFIYVSGQLPLVPSTMEFISNDIADQTKQSLLNIQAILAAGNATLEDVVKVNIFLKDMNDFAKMNEVYGQFFNTNKPARAAVQVGKLPKDALVEIEAVAFCG